MNPHPLDDTAYHGLHGLFIAPGLGMPLVLVIQVQVSYQFRAFLRLPLVIVFLELFVVCNLGIFQFDVEAEFEF